MKKITQEELDELLIKHNLWLAGEAGGKRAILFEYDLRNIIMRNCDLRRCVMSKCDMRDCIISNCELSGSGMLGSDMRNCNIGKCDMRNCTISKCDLSNCNISKCDLSGSDLSNCNTSGAKIFFPIACPEEGEFIGFKKVNDLVVKLKITEDAKRCSATSRKCRCSKAIVLSITNIDGTESDKTEVASDHDGAFIYRVGETVEEPKFCEDRWNECSEGIHFFITRKEAEDYR